MNCGRQPGSVAAPPIATVVRTQTKRHQKPSRIGFKGAICAMMAMLQPCGATPLRDLVASTVEKFALTSMCNVDGIVTQMEAFGAGQISSLPVLLNNPATSITLQQSIGENAPPAFLMLLNAHYSEQFPTGGGPIASGGAASSSSMQGVTKLLSISIVKQGTNTPVLKPKIVEVGESLTFLQCYNQYKPASFDDSTWQLRCFLATMDQPHADGWPKEVENTFAILPLAEQFGASEVIFQLSGCPPPALLTPGRNAFSALIGGQREQQQQQQQSAVGSPPMPKKATGESANAKDKLRLEVQQLFESHGLKVAPKLFPAVTEFLDQFTALLWYINPFSDAGGSLKQRAHLPHAALAGLYEQTWDDYKAKKKEKPRMSAAELDGHVGNLYQHLARPWMSELHHASIKSIVHTTVDRLQAHVAYLEAVAVRMHGRYEEIVVLDGTVKLGKFEATAEPPTVRAEWHKSWTAISAAITATTDVPYSVVPIDELLPSNRKDRARLLQSLHMQTPLMLYTFHVGGRQQDQHFVITLPDQPGSVEFIAFSQAMIDVHEQVRRQTARVQSVLAAKTFQQRWGKVVKLSPAVARGILQDLSGTTVYSQAKTSVAMDRRITALVESGDSDVVLDGRSCNGQEGSSQFDVFWEKLFEIIGAWDVCHVDERRHAEVSADRQVTEKAPEVSFRSLYEAARDACPEAPHPTQRWMEYQFWPKNTLLHSAVQYTGRFAVTMMAQSRQLRKDHDDVIVGHVEFKYLKEFCCDPRYRALIDLVAEDDKHKVNVGEPGYPVAAAQKTRRVLAGKNQVLAAADHDFTRCSLIPSVALMIDIPQHSHESFYQGQAHVTLKNAIVQPSSALRHAVETGRYYGTNPKPIVVKYHDGGSDHKDTNGAVRLACILEFLRDDRDYYLSMRCVPGQSFKDPAEHVMAVLNLAQQCVALDRRNMAPEEESAIKNANSMAAIREVISEQPGDGLRDAVLLSTKPATDLLGGLYRKAVFSGRHLEVHEPAPESDLDALFRIFTKISPTLKRTDTTRKALEADAAYQKFIKGHVKFGLYKTTIMKCNDAACPYHKPVRMAQQIWETLNWFPDATLDANSQTSGWRSFANSWGKPTTEKDYPSNKEAEKAKEDRMNTKVLHGKYAVGWVRCSLPSCRKPRVLFKAKPLTEEEKTVVLLLEENTDYTCGAPVTMAGHALHGHLFARASLRCSDPVEFDYYLKSHKFTPCCSLCGETGVELSKRQEQTALYRDVLPLCAQCKDDMNQFAPVRYNKKIREARAAKLAAATKAAAQQEAASARDPKSIWDGAMQGAFTKEQVDEFPKTCCRQPCLLSRPIAFQPNDPDSDGSPKYDSNGKAAGIVQGRKCALCKGLWHDLCCASEQEDGTAKMPFDADGIEGVCFDCQKAGASADDAMRGYSEAELKAMFEAGGSLEDIGVSADDEEVSDLQEAITGLCEGNQLLKLQWTPRAHFVAAGFEFVCAADDAWSRRWRAERCCAQRRHGGRWRADQRLRRGRDRGRARRAGRGRARDRRNYRAR